MDNPELYAKNNYATRVLSENYLQKHINFLNWKKNEEILDIGSGDGGVSLEILAPRLPDDFVKLTCVEICSDAVELAKRRSNNGKVEFLVLDIATKTLPKNFENRFQHAFSFYCLHWVFDQKQALQNIYAMLKPQGEALFTYIISSPLYAAQEVLAKSEKWRQYFGKVEEFLPTFRHSTNVVWEYKTYLNDVGFKCQECLVEDKVFWFPNFLVFSNFSCAVNRFISLIPKDRQSEYIREYIDEIVKHKVTQMETNSRERGISIGYRHMVALVFKDST